MIAILTIIDFVLVIGAILGCATYLIFGSWVAALIAGVSAIIAILVCFTVAFIITRLVKKYNNKSIKS